MGPPVFRKLLKLSQFELCEWKNLFFWLNSKLSKFFIKWAQHEFVLLIFEEVIAEKVKIPMLSSILNNFWNNEHFLMFLNQF